MKIKHVTLPANTSTEVCLPVRSTEVLVKNFTDGDLLVSIGTEDFVENYAKIPSLKAETLFEDTSDASNRFFKKLYLYGTAEGDVEIRCLDV